MQATVPIDVTRMDATIPEGIDLLMNGMKINSGPLEVRLDHQARADGDNSGELDYEENVARARFNLVIMGKDIQPIRAVVNSEGVITGDHNFGLAGPLAIQPHPLLGPEGLSGTVLPGR